MKLKKDSVSLYQHSVFNRSLSGVENLLFNSSNPNTFSDLIEIILKDRKEMRLELGEKTDFKNMCECYIQARSLQIDHESAVILILDNWFAEGGVKNAGIAKLISKSTLPSRLDHLAGVMAYIFVKDNSLPRDSDALKRITHVTREYIVQKYPEIVDLTPDYNTKVLSDFPSLTS